MSALDTCLVTGTILNPDGTPSYPATVTFKLTHRDYDDSNVVLPAPVSVDTDPAGQISIPLWPNVDGRAGTVYWCSVAVGAELWNRDRYATFVVAVPDATTADLTAISELVAPSKVDDARTAVILVQAAALAVAEDKEAVTQIKTDIEEMVGSVGPVLDSIVAVETVAGSIGSVVAVGAVAGKVVAVADDLANVDAVADNIANVDVVAGSIAAVNAASTNMAAIITAPAKAQQASDAADHVDEIAEQFGDLSSAVDAINASRDLAQDWAVKPTDVTAGNPSAKTSAAAAALNTGLTAADRVATGADRVAAAASAAQSAAAVGGVIYDTTAAGIAATTNGQFFIVKGDGVSTYATMYKNVAGVATLSSSYPDKAAIDAIITLATGGDNAGIPILIQIGVGVVATVADGQFRFSKPLHKDDLPPSDTLEIAETASGAENAGSSSVLQVGGAVVGAVTKEGQFRFMKQLHPGDIPSVSSEGTTTAYADGSSYLVSPNEMWSQWVWPRTIEDDNGNQMWGSLGKQQGPFTANGTGLVGRPGQLWIGYREAFAANTKKVMIGLSEENTGRWAARGGVDDHNRPSICLNPNPAAVYPLVAFQCDHNAKQYGRFWRSTTRNPADLTLVGQTPVNGSEYPAYAQLFWNRANPAELRGAYRIGLFDIGTWSFFVGDPGTLPSTWTYHYNKVGGDGTYFLTIPALDGSGMWLAAHRHPTVAGSKKVTVAKLKWDWSLVSGNGTVISADIRAEASPVDILDHANATVIDTMTGTRMTRLFDAREYSDGKIRFLYADFPTTGKVSYAGDYKIATYDIATNTTAIETVCRCGGMIQEEVTLNGEYVAGAGTSSYVAGACLTDRPTEIVAARWWGTYGDLLHCTRQAVNDWDEVTLDRSAGKIARPEAHARQYWETSTIKESLTPRVSYWRGSGARGGYAMFYNFNADRITIDLTAFRSTFV
ncbi:hypothetical protein [Mesorhizobium sp. M0859]|uniref:hypothetical protein n=1 Tax=Mesorhizobium sp. M0859 TaxID=2957014 RepID=UPI00333C91EA